MNLANKGYRYSKYKIGKVEATLRFTLLKCKLISCKTRIAKYKDKYQGRRCFIIGNGPSLTVEDLEKLNEEYTFSTHRIYKIFDQTNWRPTFYCAQDYQLIRSSQKEIKDINTKGGKFIGVCLGKSYVYPMMRNAMYLKLIFKPFFPDLPDFSENICEGYYEGMTVTYLCFQLAAYMGFKEIYLLGIDHKYSVERKADGTIVKDSTVKDHFDDSDELANIPRLDESTLSYISAKQYADSHGIKVYNATRGGSMSIFDRVSLEDVLRK